MRYFTADFETTVYEGQTETEVWASALVELYSEYVYIFNSIEELFVKLLDMKENITVWFHNLKFDGSFWIWLFETLGYRQDMADDNGNPKIAKKKNLRNDSYSYVITNMGVWHKITFRHGDYTIEILDSLKILPFSVKVIGESFKTKHRKTAIEYEGFRKSLSPISKIEKEYIANDVLVVKEAIELMLSEGHTSPTIGSCCFKEFKKFFDKKDFEYFFPNLYEMEIDKNVLGSQTVAEYCLKAYKGGWCYVTDEARGKIFYSGRTYDVNSLYPSVMHSKSGNIYPIGKPSFFHHKIPEKVKRLAGKRYVYFVRIKCRFKIKDGYLPTIQIKRGNNYKGTEWLKTSDVYNRATGEYDEYFVDKNGKLVRSFVILTLTYIDYNLFHEHYNVYDETILDGCYFYGEVGIFDEYINKYMAIKMESKGGKRQLAKLFLNNLYGQFGKTDNSSFKTARIEDDVIKFITVEEHDKRPGYIPIGAMVTSYARNFTIRAAQKNYKPGEISGFKYADTDSIHIAGGSVTGIAIDDKNLLCWKEEIAWDKALFIQQKRYIEMNKDECSVKCAGLGARGRQLIEDALTLFYLKKGESIKDFVYSANKKPEYTKEEIEFMLSIKGLESLQGHFTVPTNLKMKQIKGGVLLYNKEFNT